MKLNIASPVLLSIFILISGSALAKKKGKKDQMFKKGQINVQLGTSFISSVKPKSTPDYHFFGDVTTKSSLPFGIRLDYGLTENIGGGLFISKSKSTITVTDVTDATNVYGFEAKMLTIGARGTYHLKVNKKLKLDPYGYGMVGYTSVKSTLFGANNYLEPKKGTLAYSIGVGANYMLSKNAGAYLEVGYGVAVISLGAVLKI
jgi:predicted porin